MRRNQIPRSKCIILLYFGVFGKHEIRVGKVAEASCTISVEAVCIIL